MALTPSNIRVAAGRIYSGVTNPASGSPLSLTSGAPTTGIEVGLTQGESVFTFEVTYDEEMADQVLAPVAVFATQESMQLEFTMLEYAKDQLDDFFQQADYTADEISTPKTDLFTMGNLGNGLGNLVPTTSMYLVSAIPATNPQRYTIVGLYKAYQAAPATIRYTREGSSVMKSTYRAITDLARNAGDFLGQVVIERN